MNMRPIIVKSILLAGAIAVAPMRLLATVDPLDSLNDVGRQVYGTEQPQDIKVIIANGVKIVLGFVGILFILLILMGGFQWMTSGGNEKKIEEAKARITRATIGLIIIIAAYSIAYTVTNYLRIATSTAPPA